MSRSRWALAETRRRGGSVRGAGGPAAQGTVFRFALYRWWVFAPSRSSAPQPQLQPVLPGAPDRGLVGDS